MVTKGLPSATQRVVEAASSEGLAIEVVMFRQPTRTAEEAAAAIGCDVAQIVKSLVFTVHDAPVVALVSGANKLDNEKLACMYNTSRKHVHRANADMVRAATGFAIGGVPPFGHATWMDVYIDHDLSMFDVVWAAAGTPNTVFAITPSDLVRLSGGQITDLKIDSH
jgi:Cys-tRNA(Pro) deacylase